MKQARVVEHRVKRTSPVTAQVRVVDTKYPASPHMRPPLT